MTTLEIENGRPAPSVVSAAGPALDFSLRIAGALLQILTTVAVLRRLPPDMAGIYFRGFVITYSVAALLRGKYELFLTQFLVGRIGVDFNVAARELVAGLGTRVLIRGALACAALLVVTADLDVMEPHLQPFLETYLPFTLAVPFAGLALFLSGALRAVNRTLGSVLVATFGMNSAILLAALFAPEDRALEVLSWSFFAGSLVMAAVGILLTRMVFRPHPLAPGAAGERTAWGSIYAAVAGNGATGIVLAARQWGPVALLALLGTTLQIAEYAVLARTVQVIEFLIPAVVLMPQGIRFQSRFCADIRSLRGKLWVDLAVSTVITSVWVAVLIALASQLPLILGPPYSDCIGLYWLLLLIQWVNGAGRPAIRQLVVDWNSRVIRRVLFISMVVAIAIAAGGWPQYGVLAIAAGMLVGAVVENCLALTAATSAAGVPV